MVPVCDKRYDIYNRFRHFWAEIKKLWNYSLPDLYASRTVKLYLIRQILYFDRTTVLSFLSIKHSRIALNIIEKYCESE